MGMGQQNPPDCTESPKYKTASAGKKFRPPQKRLGETGAVYYNKGNSGRSPRKRRKRMTVNVDAPGVSAAGCARRRCRPWFQSPGAGVRGAGPARTPAEEAGAFDAANGCPVNAIRARKA